MMGYTPGTKLSRLVTAAAFVLITASSCIFSPDKDSGTKPVDNDVFVTQDTPLNVIHNLKLSCRRLDSVRYEQCLHPNFYYRSPSKIDEFDLVWPREDEIAVIERLMADCTSFEFITTSITGPDSQYEEYGINVPNKPDGARVTEEHPDEIWYVYNYIVDMDIFTKTHGEFTVHQDMEFKMVKDSGTGLFSIIEWNDQTPE